MGQGQLETTNGCELRDIDWAVTVMTMGKEHLLGGQCGIG